LVEEAETFGPYCRVIIHNFDEDGKTIGWDKEIGGFGVDSGYKAKAGISLANIQDETSYKIGDMRSAASVGKEEHGVKYFGAEKCELQVTKVSQTGPDAGYDPPKPKVLLHNLATRKQLVMPEFCGADAPGAFLDMSSSDIDPEGGMWVSPLVVGLVLWFVLRSTIMATAVYLEIGGNNEIDGAMKMAFTPCKFLLNTICCSFFVAPVQNMEFHDLCPQLLLSFYSGKLQLGFFYGVFGIGLAGCCGVCCLCYLQVKGQEMEDNKKKMMPVAACGGCAAAVGGLCMVVGGIWYHIKKAWWAIFFGVEFNLSWYFPEYSLAMQVNLFHLFVFFLFLGDVLDTILSCALFCKSNA